VSLHIDGSRRRERVKEREAEKTIEKDIHIQTYIEYGQCFEMQYENARTNSCLPKERGSRGIRSRVNTREAERIRRIVEGEQI